MPSQYVIFDSFGAPAGDTNSWVLGEVRNVSRDDDIKNGALFRYAAGVGIYKCPSDRSVSISDKLPRNRSYTIDQLLVYRHPSVPDALYKSTQVTSPAQVFTFLDECPEGIEDGNFGLQHAPIAQWLNLPSDRHSKGTAIAYLDGHVKKMNWLARKIYTGTSQGTASADDATDLKTLQEALPNLP